MGDWRRHWRLGILETWQLEDWGRCWRFSSWKIGNDTKELANRRLGTTLEIFALKDWRQRWRLGKNGGDAKELAARRLGIMLET